MSLFIMKWQQCIINNLFFKHVLILLICLLVHILCIAIILFERGAYVVFISSVK
jgi:hypothetical protein